MKIFEKIRSEEKLKEEIEIAEKKLQKLKKKKII
jgi:hypothetical protein